MKERRSIERYELRLPARVRICGIDEDGREIETETKDISSSGAYIITNKPLPQGTNIELEFDLSIGKLIEFMGSGGHVRVRVEGKVARADNNGVAVRFAKDYEIKALED